MANKFGNDIQLIVYNNEKWLRTRAAIIGGNTYTLSNEASMVIVQNLTNQFLNKMLTWGDIKKYSSTQDFYISRFNLYTDTGGVSADDIISKFPITEFLNPNVKVGTVNNRVQIITDIDCVDKIFYGQVSIGPTLNLVRYNSSGYQETGYGVGLSLSLMRN